MAKILSNTYIRRSSKTLQNELYMLFLHFISCSIRVRWINKLTIQREANSNGLLTWHIEYGRTWLNSGMLSSGLCWSFSPRCEVSFVSLHEKIELKINKNFHKAIKNVVQIGTFHLKFRHKLWQWTWTEQSGKTWLNTYAKRTVQKKQLPISSYGITNK